MVRLKPSWVTVAYIREPVAWYKSFWTYINNRPNTKSRIWWYKTNKDLHELARAHDFDGFIKSLPVGRLYRVYDIYTHVDITVTMDKMASHFELLTGIPLGHENKSDSGFEISHETYEMILDKEKATYERWFA
jgi:hypothetical protein